MPERPPQEPTLEFAKQGPKFLDLVEDGYPRDNPLDIKAYKTATEIENRITEREGLINLKRFLDETIELAREAKDEKIERTATTFRDNLVYIGEKELAEACEGVAGHILQRVQEGKEIYVCPVGSRSERYMALRILETVTAMTEEQAQVRSQIHLTPRGRKSAVEAAARNPEQSLMIIPDDFSVSGNRIEGFAKVLFHDLVEKGVPAPQAAQVLEAVLVAAPTRHGQLRKSPEVKAVDPDNGSEFESRIATYAYYGVPEILNEKGIASFHAFSSVAVSGSHSDVDYGFENVIRELEEFREAQGKPSEPYTLPVHMNRPYEMKDSLSYADPALEERWRKLIDLYGI